jgi:hypothetical protein
VRLIDTLRRVIAGNPCTRDESTPDTDDARDEHRPGQGNLPTISYVVHGQSVLMNNWEDPNYFTAAFPTLFPSGIGGHQDERTVPVSLAAFSEWALNHHSRKQAAILHCGEILITFTDSHAIRPSCICFMMYCNSEVRLLEMHFSSNVETGGPPKRT